MTGFRTHIRGKRGAARGFLPVIAAVCLVLLATLAVAQVAHQHPNPTSADRCQLCIVMHTAVPVAATAAAVVLVELGASAPPAAPEFVSRQRQSRLFIRPPPSYC